MKRGFQPGPKGSRVRPPQHHDGLPELDAATLNYAQAIAVGSEYTDEQREWIFAVERYQRTRGRKFPTMCELLAIAVSLGYRKDGGSVGDDAKHSVLPQI